MMENDKDKTIAILRKQLRESAQKISALEQEIELLKHPTFGLNKGEKRDNYYIKMAK